MGLNFDTIYIYASVQSEHAVKWKVALMIESCGILSSSFITLVGLIVALQMNSIS